MNNAVRLSAARTPKRVGRTSLTVVGIPCLQAGEGCQIREFNQFESCVLDFLEKELSKHTVYFNKDDIVVFIKFILQNKAILNGNSKLKDDVALLEKHHSLNNPKLWNLMSLKYEFPEIYRISILFDNIMKNFIQNDYDKSFNFNSSILIYKIKKIESFVKENLSNNNSEKTISEKDLIGLILMQYVIERTLEKNLLIFLKQIERFLNHCNYLETKAKLLYEINLKVIENQTVVNELLNNIQNLKTQILLSVFKNNCVDEKLLIKQEKYKQAIHSLLFSNN